MLTREHHVHQHPKGIDIGAVVGLPHAILFWGGESGGPEHHGVDTLIALKHPGCVEVDQNSLLSAQNDVFRFNIPVYGTLFVQHPKRIAEVPDDLPRLLLRKEGAFQHFLHVVAFDVFFQYGGMPVLLRSFVNAGEVGTCKKQQFAVDFRASFEFPEDIGRLCLFMAHQNNASPVCPAKLFDLQKIVLYVLFQKVVNGLPP